MYNPLCLETAPAKGVLAVAAAGQTLTPAPAHHSGTQLATRC
jgi:hypothetical protein